MDIYQGCYVRACIALVLACVPALCTRTEIFLPVLLFLLISCTCTENLHARARALKIFALARTDTLENLLA